MKIAILTLPLHTNYGGVLQAYALQTVLENMGHEVEVLQRKDGWSISKWKIPLIYVKRIIEKFVINRNTIVFFERKKSNEKPIIEKYTSLFIHKYLHLRYINSLYEIQPSDYDAIVVGSDQVWRKVYFSPSWNAPIRDAFLSFTRHWSIKRVAYAASFGLDNITEYNKRDINECKSGLHLFHSASVREASGIDICKTFFEYDVIQMPDPTLLLSKESYVSLVEKIKCKKSEGNLLCYILDKTSFKDKVISDISNNQNLIPFFQNADVDNLKLAVEQRIQPPLEQWLRGFMDAKFVITDSFHACIFSIIFCKPFLVIGNPDRGLSRFISLLKTFKLENRLITPSSNYDINELIKIEDLSGIIQSHQTIANEYLQNVLQ